MKSQTKTLLLSLTAALTLSATVTAPSWALQTEFVATGTVVGGTDTLGYFGPAGADLTGDSFSAIAHIDTSLGTFYSDPFGTEQSVQGGPRFQSTSPVNINFTVNGISHLFDSDVNDGFGEAILENSNVGGEKLVDVASGSGLSALNLTAFANYGQLPSVIGQSFSLEDIPSYNSAIYSNFTETEADKSISTVQLTLDSISSSGVISAAPEPSAWALLIAGVGLSGLALRLGRRRGWAMA